MKAIFAHSARFIRTPDGNVFSNDQFPYRYWGRYLEYFDDLAVICRISDVTQAPKEWNLSSGPHVTFIGTPDDHGKPLMQLRHNLASKIIRRELVNYDVVIARQSDLGWLAAEESKRKRIPLVVEVVGDPWNAYWNYGTLLSKLYAPAAWWKSRRWVGKADFALYVTHEYLQRKYPCNGISYGISDVQIDPVPESVLKNRIKKIHNEQSNTARSLSIGLIGSLFTRHKGLHVALRTLRRLREQNIQIQLHVLGNGNIEFWRKEAEQLGVSNQLFLEGTLPSGDQVMQWLDNLDIYIQPSLTEGMPRALIEAMSRGLPALGSNCGGIPELLPAEYLHNPGDNKTLAEQLKRIVQNRTLQLQQAERNFKEAQKYYYNEIRLQQHNFWHKFLEYSENKSKEKKVL